MNGSVDDSSSSPPQPQPKTRTEPFILALAVGGFLEPLSASRSGFTTSRILILDDGTPKPVLVALAERKFGAYSPHLFPFWIDGDRRNETLQNVDLAVRKARPMRRRLKR